MSRRLPERASFGPFAADVLRAATARSRAGSCQQLGHLLHPKTGNVRWEAARESDHDDIVIALALALWRKHSRGEPRYMTDDGPQDKPWAIPTNPS